MDVGDDGDSHGPSRARGNATRPRRRAWLAVAAWLWQTTVPDLDLDGLDAAPVLHGADDRARARLLRRRARLIWLLSTVATLVALVVLVRVVPRRAADARARPDRERDRDRDARARHALVRVAAVRLRRALVAAPLRARPVRRRRVDRAQRYTLAASAVFAMLAIVVVVGFAGRFGRRWWLLAAPRLRRALPPRSSFLAGWLLAADTKPVRDPKLRADVDAARDGRSASRARPSTCRT